MWRRCRGCKVVQLDMTLNNQTGTADDTIIFQWEEGDGDGNNVEGANRPCRGMYTISYSWSLGFRGLMLKEGFRRPKW